MTKTDKLYSELVSTILSKGSIIPGRNGETYRSFTLPTITFDSTPLVTLRKTAWQKAIREMEWFLSGQLYCPDELMDWWDKQLSPAGAYKKGYGQQLRCFNERFDQISNLIKGLRLHPFSRRHVITTWNPEDMHSITLENNNPLTPTTCHTTIAQFFVDTHGLVSMHSYQRSADMLLGVPHNWIQSWALLLWVAEQIEGIADKLLWTFGDAHVYKEESHLQAASQLKTALHTYRMVNPDPPRLLYKGKPGRDFDTNDFEMIGDVPPPAISIKPALL